MNVYYFYYFKSFYEYHEYAEHCSFFYYVKQRPNIVLITRYL